MDQAPLAARTRRSPGVVLSVLVLLGVLCAPVAAAQVGGSNAAGDGAAGAPGTAGVAGTDAVPVVVGFHGRPEPALVRRLGGTVTDTFSVIPAVAARVPAAAVAALARQQSVDYVERDETVQLGDSGDPDPVVRAAASNASAGGGNETVPWGVERVGAAAVHRNGTDGDRAVVAVLDSGVDADHPELTGSYAGGVDLVNDDPVPEDRNGHGTHVAGTIAAADDGRGVVGVAPGAAIYGVKVLNASGNGTLSDLVAGIEWAVAGPDGDVGTDDDADVITMSIGSFVGPESLRKAVTAAYREHGVLVVGAAGNVGELDFPDTVMFPARYDAVVSVGALDRRGARPPWSGAGPRLELTAPGVDVLSTATGGGDIRGEGTSMAAPHVAGVAALVLDSAIPDGADRDGDGEWDPREVRARLRATARDLGPDGRDGQFGHGLVDAAAAVGDPRPNEAPTVRVTAPAVSTVSGAVTVRANVSDPEDIDAGLRVTVAVDGTRVGAATYNESTRAFEYVLDTAVLAEDARHRVTVTATDEAGATGADAAAVTVDNTDDPPDLAVRSPVAGAGLDRILVVRAAAGDDRTPPGDLDVAFRLDGGNWTPLRHLGGGRFVAVDAVAPPGDGRHVLTVRVTDGGNATTTARVVLNGTEARVTG